ncbi:hypothetical protein SNE40_000361 [Patella caerulea]|uniref:Rab9 effector protein with kelch motifs n=1 Tax=Patella caerulea TaxID=87958 RepID=A0AAN8KGF7_PATCE
MELHPILEKDTQPNSGLWYVLSALGDSPTMRVGHTCTYIKGPDESSKGRVYVIGGADPSGSFGDVYVLDLENLQWDTMDTPGFKSRYEHVAFVPEIHPDKIYIFGGADQTGNLNDIQVLDITTNNWSNLTVQGTPPSPRTHHTTAVVGNKMVVYSGGHSGADPVGDRKIHVFDVSTSTWSQPSIKGDPPKPRHGHVMVSLGNKIYVHGGMATATFYDDLHVLDLAKESWTSIKKKKSSPSARAAHGGAVHGTNLYIFGGMNKDGALDDMHKLDTVSMTWSEVKLDGPPPSSRLDFGMCVVDIYRSSSTNNDDQSSSSINELRQNTTHLLEKDLEVTGSVPTQTTDVKAETETEKLTESVGACNIVDVTDSFTTPDTATNNSATGDAVVTSIADMKTYTLCLVNGGMDTVGEIFDDTLVMLLK